MSKFRKHIIRAIKLCGGSQVKLAKQAGCSQQYISWLLKDAEKISVEMALSIEKATDGEVSRQDLRPDVFGSVAPARKGRVAA